MNIVITWERAGPQTKGKELIPRQTLFAPISSKLYNWTQLKEEYKNLEKNYCTVKFLSET
jgi:hypothetical protein